MTTYIGTIGQGVLIHLRTTPADSALFPRALIYDSSDSLIATVDLANVLGGPIYQALYAVPSSGQFSIDFVIYEDAGHTIDLTSEFEIESDHLIGDLAQLQPDPIVPSAINPARLP